MRTGPEYKELKALVRREGLHTVCEEAGCPNIYECWEDREATFLIGGEQCTRRCDFCQIDTGKPAELDRDEPRRVAESVQAMGLRYSTVTGVARDDLPDGGAWLYAETVRQIKALNPNTGVELLIPDFNGIAEQLETVFETRPEVLAHNVETVPRIFKRIRPAFRYQRSLDVLTAARNDGLVTKSNLILGMGETPDEMRAALTDLYEAGCDIVTITQYLRPPSGITRWSGGSSPRSSSSISASPRSSGSPVCSLVRWFVRRIGRAGCTQKPRASDWVSRPTRILIQWRRSAIPRRTRPPRPRRRRPARRRPSSGAASCGRHSRFSARKTSGCCRT